VRVILQDLDEAHGLVSSQTKELAGVLRLLAPPVLATHVLAPLVSGFRQAYPKILLDIDVESHREPPIEDYDITLMGAKDNFDANVIARKVISTEAVLLASPDYLQRKGTPQKPEDLQHHDCLRLKPSAGRSRAWRLLHADEPDRFIDIDVQPVLWANHTDTLMRAALDGAGITATTVELAAPLLNNGDLVRVVSPWITDRLTLYAALPSRKFMPQRTQVFLDYLTEQTRLRVVSAIAACDKC
jgi:DNA-binding transcriptional LysR family regulator